MGHTPTQHELPWAKTTTKTKSRRKGKKARRVNVADVELFLSVLREADGWLTSDRILARMIGKVTAQSEGPPDVKRFGRDYIRHLRKWSSGMATGMQGGYRLTLRISHAECQAAADALLTSIQGIDETRRDMLHVFHHGGPRPQGGENGQDAQETS